MKKTLAILVVGMSLFISGCTDPDGATRTLQSAGYTNIVITGHRFGQGDDQYSTGFEATSPNGTRVTGAVTRGAETIFGTKKGSTIRLD